ncbi:hypothetical protein ASPBRDRAFT_40356 [Aspergillus brasiliensis CBS 101740]|uniref:Hydrophobin n=1 Tax=Aspergillus brasiliensis (strain CBS 101740 / IMI 381727 / IBT 21946) TaxID=767769 RepID=A0A1L9UTM2_ASPBC|nr:hypothetical protein ASPBRDRAFT_40356 [Aspergillus brasiliensis CBS 101740]
MLIPLLLFLSLLLLLLLLLLLPSLPSKAHAPDCGERTKLSGRQGMAIQSMPHPAYGVHSSCRIVSVGNCGGSFPAFGCQPILSSVFSLVSSSALPISAIVVYRCRPLIPPFPFSPLLPINFLSTHTHTVTNICRTLLGFRSDSAHGMSSRKLLLNLASKMRHAQGTRSGSSLH